MNEYGTWSPYIGIYAMKLGYNVEIFTYDVSLFDPTWFNLSNKSLIKKLKIAIKKIKDKDKKFGVRGYIDFLREGGKLTFKIPTKKILIKFLKKKIPPMAFVNSTAYYKRKRKDFKAGKRSEFGEVGGHCIVISGYKNGKFIVTDPNYFKGGIYEVPEDKLIFTWSNWGGELVVVKPSD